MFFALPKVGASRIDRHSCVATVSKFCTTGWNVMVKRDWITHDKYIIHTPKTHCHGSLLTRGGWPRTELLWIWARGALFRL